MSHQCIINIDNSNNSWPLVLSSVTGPDGTGSADGSFGSIIPATTTIEYGATIPEGASLSFVLTGGDIEPAGATLVWTTGAGDTAATIAMTFENSIFGNTAALNAAAAENSSSGLLAYGVSYFYASEVNNSGMARDYINTVAGTIKDTSPVYVNYSVVLN